MKNQKSTDLAVQNSLVIDEAVLFERVSAIIDNRKFRAQAVANSEGTLMFWEVGQYVNSVVLKAKRAAYGKQIVATLSLQLQEKYGNSFELTNLHRMMRFAERFPDYSIRNKCELSPDKIFLRRGDVRFFFSVGVIL